eukprot:gene12821-biopygen5660
MPALLPLGAAPAAVRVVRWRAFHRDWPTLRNRPGSASRSPYQDLLPDPRDQTPDSIFDRMHQGFARGTIIKGIRGIRKFEAFQVPIRSGGGSQEVRPVPPLRLAAGSPKIFYCTAGPVRPLRPPPPPFFPVRFPLRRVRPPPDGGGEAREQQGAAGGLLERGFLGILRLRVHDSKFPYANLADRMGVCEHDSSNPYKDVGETKNPRAPDRAAASVTMDTLAQRGTRKWTRVSAYEHEENEREDGTWEVGIEL